MATGDNDDTSKDPARRVNRPTNFDNSNLPDSTVGALVFGTNGIKPIDPDGRVSGVAFDGDDKMHGANLFRMRMVRTALNAEVRSGLKMTRGSVLAVANDILGTNYKRKQHALDHLSHLLEPTDPQKD